MNGELTSPGAAYASLHNMSPQMSAAAAAAAVVAYGRSPMVGLLCVPVSLRETCILYHCKPPKILSLEALLFHYMLLHSSVYLLVPLDNEGDQCNI